MPKIQAGVSVPATFFNLNGLDYPKQNYEPFYVGVEGTPPDTVDEDLVQVGLRQKFTGRTLQAPALFGEWTDNTDTPYASLTALLTALDSLVDFVP